MEKEKSESQHSLTAGVSPSDVASGKDLTGQAKESSQENLPKSESLVEGGVSVEAKASESIAADAVSFLWEASSQDAVDTVWIVSPTRYRDDMKLETWRQMGQCTDCSQKFNVDLLTIGGSSEMDREEWLKILAPMYQAYSKKITLKVLVLPGLQDSFLLHLRDILDQAPTIERIILIDPGALEGLNGIVNLTSTASKMSKGFKNISSLPSLEVLGLFNGRSFEKDRRRIMAGNSAFLYTELGMADNRGLDYLVEWFLMSRFGIKSPFAYGSASKQDMERIRGVSPAAWFQRSQGSLTEETSDDVLKLMLP